MDFNDGMAQAWNDHADDARSVATRLPALLALASDEAQLDRVIGLGHHVHGVHLGDWAGGSAALDAVRAHAAYRDDGTSGQSLRRSLASLALCAGTAPHGLSASDQIRVHALATDGLLAHDPKRAAGLFEAAVALCTRSGLPDSDPMHRAMAVAGNNIASTLEQKPDRSADERALMILAAQTARHHWALAGGWLEVERAEYRLAMTWLQAGDAAQARHHAQACLDIVEANGSAALERLFGWEALGLSARAIGDTAGHAHAVAMARAALAELPADDQAWCAASVEALAAPA